MANTKTAFVFAGGGSLGAVEVGMLRTLNEADVAADFVVGSSAGAINAAYFAGNPTADGIRRLEAIWCTVRRSTVFPARPTRSVLAVLGMRNSIVAPTSLRQLLERVLPYEALEDARIPCHVVATDVRNGEEVLLSSGSAVDAVLASAAIPGVFPPVSVQGRQLIDGGIASNTPIAAAVALGARRVIVLPTGFSCEIDEAPRDALGMSLHALHLLIARQLARDVERFRFKVELLVVPPLCPLARSPYDFARTAELIERAAENTWEWLDAGGLSQSGMSGALESHSYSGGSDDACPFSTDSGQPRDSGAGASLRAATVAADGSALASGLQDHRRARARIGRNHHYA